jgi:hypothetical protein
MITYDKGNKEKKGKEKKNFFRIYFFFYETQINKFILIRKRK